MAEIHKVDTTQTDYDIQNSALNLMCKAEIVQGG